MRGLLKLFKSGINPKRTKNTATPKRLLFTQPPPGKAITKDTLLRFCFIVLLRERLHTKKPLRKGLAMRATRENTRATKKIKNATVKL
jgi:hypothetical protein